MPFHHMADRNPVRILCDVLTLSNPFVKKSVRLIKKKEPSANLTPAAAYRRTF